MSLNRWLAFVALLTSSFASLFATPYPGYYYPSGMQAGTKIRVVVGGTAMGGVTGAHVTGDGVRVTRIIRAPGFPRAVGKTQLPWVDQWLYDILEGKDRKHRELPPEALDEKTDWSESLWWPYLDELGELELEIVVRDRCTPLNYPQPTPALSQILLLDVEADADAIPGRRDIIIYDGNSASAPHSFYITKEAHVKERFFVIPTREQFRNRHVPEILHHPTPIPPQKPPCIIDGQVWPGEVDQFSLQLEKGQHLVCALTGRELLPYLGDAVPGFFNPEMRLRDASGKRVAAADDFFYLPDPVLTYLVPSNGIYTLEVCDNLYRGRSDFVYFVNCFTVPDERPVYTPQSRAFECFPPALTHQPPAASSNCIVRLGTLDMPGREDRHWLDIKEPGTWKIELFARRQGSPIDGVLRLYGPMSAKMPLSAASRLAEWDDEVAKLFAVKNVGDDEHPIIKTNKLFVGSVPQVECDPIGTWKFLVPGRYCIVVSDRVGAGGENYTYALSMEPVKPTFEVYASTSAFVDDTQRAGVFKAHLLRLYGFDGIVEFDSTEDWSVTGEFEEGQVETEVSVEYNKGTWKGVACVPITATGRMRDGTRITVPVTPCDSVEQAFAYTHLLPQRGFYFCAQLGTNLVEAFAHPLPHLLAKSKVKMKTRHSNGQACVKCHDKKTRKHTNGKACTSCHKNKD